MKANKEGPYYPTALTSKKFWLMRGQVIGLDWMCGDPPYEAPMKPPVVDERQRVT
jgi:hypothetical protein